jgi:ubiquitin-conjugating enzyme E2 variant
VIDDGELSDYSRAQRIVHSAGIVIFAVLTGMVALRMGAGNVNATWWLIALAAISAYVVADFLSGFVHWIFDTWGSVDTPVLGRSVIRPFREHHVDALSITRHDFVETNGNNCCASIPLLASAYIIPVDSRGGILSVSFLFFLSVSVLATNQFHKWAHAEHPGATVRWLQRWRLILPADHHAVHHTAPYETHYCITTGWLNPVLHSIGFYRGLERLISRVTGALPRERGLSVEGHRAAAPPHA